MTSDVKLDNKSIEQKLAEQWIGRAVALGDDNKSLIEEVLAWKQHFLDYGNHKFDCAGNDGTVCQCEYLQIWQKAFDDCKDAECPKM